MSMTAKGGKFVYAWSLIAEDGSLHLPEQALQEYGIVPGPVLLMSGRNTSSGFNVMCKELIPNSPLAAVFASLPQLQDFSIQEGGIIPFKGRLFCWASLRSDNCMTLPLPTLKQWGLRPGDKLLCLRGSHLSFSCLAKGPYVDRAESSYGIKVYRV
ncbi:hypothetical protein AWM70_06705 [Paenibacillus yonginensis]|uniref:Uncharacterized protein n=1 Tax=Paenibacillus yonginensis TaxID=1462996 RepID=A0A1B1MYR4_9BACL|nr:hypothetical protein [Paenibacillus yonginensis]ANS74311.1 hypothetical protein AWM70_06705 [Paenibacillus yonginensis]